jgi:tight adherence protein C
MTLAISIIVFLLVTAGIILFGYRRYVVAGRLYAKLGPRPDERPPAKNAANPHFYSVVQVAESLGCKVPPSAATASQLQLNLLAAGHRDQNAVAVLYGFKLMTMTVLPLALFLIGVHSAQSPIMRLMMISLGILGGFRLPDFFLARRVTKRKKHLRKSLPDALDLIIVCAEAGLTIDRAFRSVTQQLAIVHPELSDEFDVVTAEISAGLRRKEAIENLGLRTQEPEIRKFTGVITQADRFGTSLGDALRAHADYLRIRRRQEADERASKVGVKMIFPIFFFIMPCMLLVTLGPAVIVIMKQLVPAFEGGR